MLIKGILKSYFLISLHQGMLSIFYFRIQDYMLSLINEVDSCLLLPLCFVRDTKLLFLTYFSLQNKKYIYIYIYTHIYKRENDILGKVQNYPQFFILAFNNKGII